MDSLYQILCLSLNHKTTPLAERERVVFQAAEIPAFLQSLREQFHEAVLLSTCNRTELFVMYPGGVDEDRAPQLLGALAAARGFAGAAEPPFNYELARNEQAVRHLFRVSAGLESQLLGESQILGQVREAAEIARAAGTAGRILHRLWEKALRAGKRVRSETALGEGALSASYAALELARKVFGTLRGRVALVIGAGEIASLVIKNLKGMEIGALHIANRTRERADELARQAGGVAVDFAALETAIVEADFVISSTSAPAPIVDYEAMRRIRHRRRGDRPLLIIDLAMPRDFDPRAGHLDLVFLKNLDDLIEIVQRNRLGRLEAIPQAEAIVEAECESMRDWLRILGIEPTILQLRERYEVTREEELARLRPQLDAEAFERVDRMTRRLVNRLLHMPSENLRRHEALRDREVHKILHEVLTREIPHRKSQENV